MEKRILVCGGCSYTGGGGFNNPEVFKKEFLGLLDSPIKVRNLRWDNPEFTEFIKNYLWPENLKKLTGHDLVYNCAIGGRGPESTLNFFIDLILKLKEENPKAKIDAIYQIPESAREEIWYDRYERPVCLLTNFDDDFEPKEYYYTNFFNDEFSFMNQIDTLYRLKKMMSSMGINLNLFCWDNKFIKNSNSLKRLNKEIKNSKKNDANKRFWSYHDGNVLSIEKEDLRKKIDFLNIIDFRGQGLGRYGEIAYDNFNFYQKYGVQDTHASKDGMKIIANLLYEKIFKEEKSYMKKILNKIFG